MTALISERKVSGLPVLFACAHRIPDTRLYLSLTDPEPPAF